MAVLALSATAVAHSQEIQIPPTGRAAPLYTEDTLTIRILGDMMMHSSQIVTAHSGGDTYDFSTYFTFIGDQIKEADLAAANMEFTLAGRPYSGYPCFSAPDSYAEYLADCGFDIFLAANNHIFDKGTEGAVRTLETYRRLRETHGIMFTGLAGSMEEMDGTTPLLIRRKGIKLAVVNFTYGTNSGLGTVWPKTNYIGEKTSLGRAISKAEEEGADFIMALPHWGEEYVLKHTEKQEKAAKWLVGCGVDLIIGSHPHVVQDCAGIDGVPVIYSLGNAISNMSAANTQLGLMVTIRIARDGNGDFTVLPPELEFLWCSRPGGYSDSYTVIPVERFRGRKDEWKNQNDYWKMVNTYERVKNETGL